MQCAPTDHARRAALVAALMLVTGCNTDWLTGVAPEKPEPCEPTYMEQVPVTATDSARADSTGVPVVLIGFCGVKS